MVTSNRKDAMMFFSGGWTIGGVERVTVVLANELASRGHDVTVCFGVLMDGTLLKGLDERVHVLTLTGGRMDAAKQLRNHIRACGIRCVFNASSRTLFLKYVCIGTGCQIVKYNHTRPGANSHVLAGGSFQRLIWRLVTKLFIRVDYALSSRYIVLSKAFVPELGRLLGKRELMKVRIVENPLTCEIRPIEKKEKVVLYVGRLQEPVKRVSRVIEIWRIVCERHKDWRLEIVGDGPDRGHLEDMAKGLPRVSFHGFASSLDYYPKASILLLTSDFEGFPLVLRESQVHGCVPVVLGSFASVVDSVTDGEDGCVLPIPYDSNVFVECVEQLMNDPCELDRLSRAARSKKDSYSSKATADKLFRIMEELK